MESGGQKGSPNADAAAVPGTPSKRSRVEQHTGASSSTAASDPVSPIAFGKRARAPSDLVVNATAQAKRHLRESSTASSPWIATVQETSLGTPRAAEALVASVRKSESAKLLDDEDTGVCNGLTDATPPSSDPEHLLQSGSLQLSLCTGLPDGEAFL